MVDPFKQLNKYRIEEPKRFDMAFEIFRDLRRIRKDEELDILTDAMLHKDHDLADLAFDVVDGFIEQYREKFSK